MILNRYLIYRQETKIMIYYVDERHKSCAGQIFIVGYNDDGHIIEQHSIVYFFLQTLPEGRTVSDELLVLLACGRAR